MITQPSYLLTVGVITLAASLAGLVFCLVVYQIGDIYRRNFLRDMDSGLQDIFLYMDPKQLLQALLLLLILVIPLSLYLLNLTITVFLVIAILLAPRLVIMYLMKKRQKRFAEQLPDTLVALATAMRSGLSLVQAMQQVVKNQPAPISQEFAQVLIEYRVGQDLVDSLVALQTRIPREELILVNSAIMIARRVGGNLSETFESLADTIREKMKIEGRIEALTAMGRAQGWLAIFFPIIMGYTFYKLEPVAMLKLFTTLGGWIWLSIMLVMVVFAAFLIRKIVNIDV
jgi:tight adherence protein B